MDPTQGAGPVVAQLAAAEAALTGQLALPQPWRLVDAVSGHDAALRLVIPGDVVTSFLLDKLGPAPAHGVRMPRNRAALLEDEIATIRAWIEDGAPEGDYGCE